MNHKDEGLTVGELTMAIGVLIIASLIWSSIANKSQNNRTSIVPIDQVHEISKNKFN